MSGQSREFISAMIDDEATEIETHRLLRDLASQSESFSLIESFFSFQQVRQVISKPADAPAGLSIDQHVALFERISAAVADEDSYDIAVKSQRNWVKPVAGFAVAASLLVAVGVAVITDDRMGNPAAIVDAASTPPVRFQSQSPLQTQTVSTASIQPGISAESELQPELRELDEEKQRKLREYLNQHTQMSRLNGQQMVTYPQSSRK